MLYDRQIDIKLIKENDWYGQYSQTAETNPAGPGTGDEKVLRGGWWIISDSYVRSAFRVSRNPRLASSNNGFRCVGAPTSITQ